MAVRMDITAVSKDMKILNGSSQARGERWSWKSPQFQIRSASTIIGEGGIPALIFHIDIKSRFNLKNNKLIASEWLDKIKQDRFFIYNIN